MKLHITNGDCAGEMIKDAKGVEGEVLCWRDLLHDGPLAIDKATHRCNRIEYLQWFLETTGSAEEGSLAQITQDFLARDRVIASLDQFDEIVLWFEHDLYDQLQLLEICHVLLDFAHQLPEISIICIDDHPSVPVFHGLGNLTPDILTELYPQRVPVSRADLKIAGDIWKQLTESTPQSLENIISEEVPGWPFMSRALRRFCCEFPATETGLTLTQTYLLLTLLRAPDELPALEQQLKGLERNDGLPEGKSAEQRYYEILTGPASFRRIFHHLQQLEVDPFMGDLSVKLELERLLNAEIPYVKTTGSGDDPHYSLTPEGAEALQGRRQWHLDNKIDLWRGGIHITNENLWMWDQQDTQFAFIC
ncbi:DUF1835 domain-containing protein [Neptuniibacter caesariensis]|uniref:DUF1835 domain-containing protein n=1 Tax=Neptuniibacter caesariensis TaxID=207954 RepID=A0A7U8C6K8_NEPCE|nr:DUF1835 domain-containing protein [Neptuniibacter caesariensis]EAR61666.1 hypothetical protein MED92_03687 [Neptuniibacter caesariensis]